MDVSLGSLHPTLVGEIKVNIFSADFFQPGEYFVTIDITDLFTVYIWLSFEVYLSSAEICIGGAIAPQ
jgi:hypothetical protein